MASSHDTIASSVSSGSDETSLKKKRQGPQLGEEEMGTSSFISPWFFCRPPSDSAASCSRTEWAPQNCLSAARFNEERMGLQVPASEEDLEDTASSKFQPDMPIAAAAIGPDCRQKRRVGDTLAGLVPHSVGENSPGKPLHFSNSISQECFFSNLSDLATVCSSSEWGPEKCQSTARPNGEPEPQHKLPRRISQQHSFQIFF